MNITRKNYEVFLTDYIDGRLDPAKSTELMDFLSMNPDLKKEFEEYEYINILPPENIYKHKNLLKKSFSDINKIDDTNFDELCIASLEGDLEKKDETILQNYLENNPEKQRDYKLYTKLRLKPDNSIHYPGKGNIRRPVIFAHKKRSLYLVLSSAAAVIIMIMLVFIDSKEKKDISKMQISKIIKEEQLIEETGNRNKTGNDKEIIADVKVKQQDENIILAGINENVPDKTENDGLIRKEEMLVYLTPVKPLITGAYEYPSALQNRTNPVKVHREEYPVARNLTIQELRNMILHNNITDNLNKIDFWTAAEAGIKSFNYLTESEVKLDKQLNSEGKIVAFALNSESFSISSSRAK